MEKRAPVHTIVGHWSPDIELLFMLYIILTKQEMREKLGVIESPSLKFIPAGKLRAVDFPGEVTLDPTVLELDPTVLEDERGYLFLDCGGGRFDQHVLGEEYGGNTTSSLELLMYETGLHDMFPHLEKIIAAIAYNDRSGGEIVARREHEDDALTPHTQRQLRNMIIGWNMLRLPATVVEFAKIAFGSIECAIGAHQMQLLEDDPSGAKLASDQFDHREFFWCDRIIAAAPKYFAAAHNVHDVEQATLAFKDLCEKALVRLEQEWLLSERHYWSGATSVQRYAVKDVGSRTVCVGRSLTQRFSAVARYGNKTPSEGRPERWSADLTIQFGKPGYFSVTTRGGIKLPKIAQAIREADLAKRGVVVTDELRATLDRPGNVVAVGVDGEPVEAIFFAIYETCVGNMFRSNPFATPTALTEQEIEQIAVRTLGTQGF